MDFVEKCLTKVTLYLFSCSTCIGFPLSFLFFPYSFLFVFYFLLFPFVSFFLFFFPFFLNFFSFVSFCILLPFFLLFSSLSVVFSFSSSSVFFSYTFSVKNPSERATSASLLTHPLFSILSFFVSFSFCSFFPGISFSFCFLFSFFLCLFSFLFFFLEPK